MTVVNPVEGGKPPPKRKPIWPWLVVLALTLAAIYAHHRISLMMDDLAQLARDFVQLMQWIVTQLDG